VRVGCSFCTGQFAGDDREHGSGAVRKHWRRLIDRRCQRPRAKRVTGQLMNRAAYRLPRLPHRAVPRLATNGVPAIGLLAEDIEGLGDHSIIRSHGRTVSGRAKQACHAEQPYGELTLSLFGEETKKLRPNIADISRDLLSRSGFVQNTLCKPNLSLRAQQSTWRSILSSVGPASARSARCISE
jgi:hypothetical protein